MSVEASKNLDPASSSLATSWIADLYPSSENFRLALRSFFDRWLGEPARRHGFARWGFKEIRLGATEATLLQWLYPRAKFVILTRHPYDCYRSWADSGWEAPIVGNRSINSAVAFSRFWNQMALSWSELPAGFPSFFMKYEDVVAGKVDFRELESWLGIEIKEGTALSVAIGGTAKRRRLSWLERFIIAREAAQGMDAFGYSTAERIPSKKAAPRRTSQIPAVRPDADHDLQATPILGNARVHTR